MNKINLNRRYFLKLSSIMTAGLAVAFSPLKLFAAWNKEAFLADKMSDAMQKQFGTVDYEMSDKIDLKVAMIAENGAVVPITISSNLPNTDSLAVFVEKNPTPLVVGFEIAEAVKPEISTRIKMGQTSKVYAVARSDGKLYATQREVKVTIGGCGG